MVKILVFALILAISDLPLSAAPRLRLECGLKRGDMVDVEMQNGTHVVGRVGSIDGENITIEQAPNPGVVVILRGHRGDPQSCDRRCFRAAGSRSSSRQEALFKDEGGADHMGRA